MATIFDSNAPNVPYFIEPIGVRSYGTAGPSITQGMYFRRERVGLRVVATPDVKGNNSVPRGVYESCEVLTRRDGAVFIVTAGDSPCVPPVFLRKTDADRQPFADQWAKVGGEPTMPQQYTDTPLYPAA